MNTGALASLGEAGARADPREALKLHRKSLEEVHDSKLERTSFDLRLRHEVAKIALLDRHEGRLLVIKAKVYLADRAVAVLLYENLGDIGALIHVAAILHHVFAVDEHDDVGVLLDGS